MASKPQKMSSDPFCCSKVQCKCIFVPCHLLHVSLPHFTAVLRMCTIALFNHKPHLIVTHVNNWSAPLFNGSRPSFFRSVNGTWELVGLTVAHPQPNVPLVPIIWMLPWLWHISVSFKWLEKVKHFYLSKCIQVKAILIFVMKPGTSSWEPQRSQN